jgi:hypothetical protein
MRPLLGVVHSSLWFRKNGRETGCYRANSARTVLNTWPFKKKLERKGREATLMFLKFGGDQRRFVPVGAVLDGTEILRDSPGQQQVPIGKAPRS